MTEEETRGVSVDSHSSSDKDETNESRSGNDRACDKNQTWKVVDSSKVGEFRLHFFEIHALLTSSKEVAPSIAAQVFIDHILEAGSLNSYHAPSSQEETYLVLAFITACTDMEPYLQGLSLLLPWRRLDREIDNIFFSKNEYSDDFCWSPFSGTQFLTDVMREGFIPLADCIAGYKHPAVRKNCTRKRLPSLKGQPNANNVLSGDCINAPRVSNQPRFGPRLVVLLPKLGRERCILRPSEVHISKNTRKRSARFTMTVNQCFDRVVQGCIHQHGESWLYPPVAAGLEERLGHTDGGPAAFSIEVYFEDRLVAGELGVTNGVCYTSYTGFASMNSAGSVQLATLGRLLQQRGIRIWDLGMSLKYKLELGGHCVSRRKFVPLFRKAREKTVVDLTLLNPTNCRSIIDSGKRDVGLVSDSEDLFETT